MNNNIFKNEIIEIGKIPSGWKIVKLHELGENHDSVVAGPFGSNLKVSDYRDEGIPIVRLQNIERNRFLDKDIKYISEEKAKELQYHSFKAGDLLLAKLGNPIGKTCLVPQSMRNGIVVADVVRVRVSSEKAITQFMEFVLNCDYCTKQLNKQTIGTTRPRVNLTDVRELMIAFPPPSEQRKIASILSKVDDLIQKTDEIIEQTQRLKKGLMQKLLTKGIGHTRFKKITNRLVPESWKIKRFEEFAQSYRYPTFYGIQYQSVGIPVLNIGNIDGQNWKLSTNPNDYQKIDKQTSLRFNRTIVEEDDLVLAVRGATIGKLAVVPKILSSSNINANLLKISLSRETCNPYFFWYYCQSGQGRKDFRKFISYTAKETIQAGKLRQWEIVLPPLREQHRIAEILRSVELTVENWISFRNTVDRLKKGLMQKLLTGKIRVKV